MASHVVMKNGEHHVIADGWAVRREGRRIGVFARTGERIGSFKRRLVAAYWNET